MVKWIFPTQSMDLQCYNGGIRKNIHIVPKDNLTDLVDHLSNPCSDSGNSDSGNGGQSGSDSGQVLNPNQAVGNDGSVIDLNN